MVVDVLEGEEVHECRRPLSDELGRSVGREIAQQVAQRCHDRREGHRLPFDREAVTDERVHVDGLEDLGHERRLADAELARYDGNLTVPVRCGEEHGTHTLALAVTSEE